MIAGIIGWVGRDDTALPVERVEHAGQFDGIVRQVMRFETRRRDLDDLRQPEHLADQLKFRRVGEQ